MIKKKKKQEKLAKNKMEYDPYLLERIQPQGGITFRDARYILTGGGYETCIHIYEFPRRIGNNWLIHVCNIDHTVVTVDLSTDNIVEVKKNINRSMKEQNLRYMEATDFQQKYDAKQRYLEMENLYDEINALGEVIKLLHVRIFVADRSLVKLEEKVKNIMAQLESNGYKTTVFLNEMKTEWMSMYQPYQIQKQELFFTYGQPLTSSVVAEGNPFHFSSLEDPTGFFLGKTPCGGNVIYDEFTKSKTRLSYNSLAIGIMGSGKSTLLKKMMLSEAIRGNYIRVFDNNGEFKQLASVLGGKVIEIQKESGILNPLEILNAEDDEGISFTRHISKVSTIYKYLVEGETTTEEIITFEENLRELYAEFGLKLEKGKVAQKVTGLPADQYPIFSDFLHFLERKIKQIQSEKYDPAEIELIKRHLMELDKIRKVISNIVNTYGSIFDGYSSFDNILDEQIVVFDITSLKNEKAGVFDAQIFNILSLCWDNCVTNGKIMMDRVARQEGDPQKIEMEDVTKFLMIIDESHRWVNTKKNYALEAISIYLREARKFFGGIILASQSIRDFVPEGSGTEEIDNLKKIFELTQYKFILQQDSNSDQLIEQVFGNSLTGSQLSQISKLSCGEALLCIASDRTIQVKIELDKEEESLFKGGV